MLGDKLMFFEFLVVLQANIFYEAMDRLGDLILKAPIQRLGRIKDFHALHGLWKWRLHLGLYR